MSEDRPGRPAVEGRSLDRPPDIHLQVVVDTDPMRAFDAFTAIGRWWPLADRQVLEGGVTVGFVDGQLVERSADGRTALWGTVIRWEPGVAVALRWHPGRDPEAAGRVEVTFAPTEGQTLVTLVHSGWAGYADPAGARADYNRGWPRMLDLFGVEATKKTVRR